MNEMHPIGNPMRMKDYKKSRFKKKFILIEVVAFTKKGVHFDNKLGA
jgi:hypothetical protein